MNHFWKAVVAVILILAVLATFYFFKVPVQSPIKPEGSMRDIRVEEYISQQNGQKLSVGFDESEKQAILYPNESGEVILYASSTATSTVYQNDVGLILLLHENSISLLLNDSRIFEGSVQLK